LYFTGQFKNNNLMKSTILMAVLAVSFVSCKKDSFKIPDVTPQPHMEAKIYHVINEPRETVLGDSTAVFTVGERMTIYVPYEAIMDNLSSATLTITDEAGNVMAMVDMTQSTDMMAGQMNVPQQLQGASFVFATIDLGEEYAGRTLSIHSQVSGGQTVSDDAIQNAFSVQY
jgi:hypothetical protein